MTASAPPRGPVRADRAERGARRRSRRGVVLGVVAAVVVLVAGMWLLARDGSEPPNSAGTPAKAPAAPKLLALEVDGGPAPMLAVVAVPPDATPFVMPLSSELTLVMPGQGETSAAGIAALSADSMRVALSNMTGVWIDHYVAMSLKDLAASVDAAGGLLVNLPSAYPTTAGSLGPGELTISGAQAKAFLEGATDDVAVRWEILLGALLADPPDLVTTPGVESDDAEAANETFIDARGAEVLDVPTERVTSTIVVPVYPALDESLSDRLGTPLPVLVSVQNGSGRPGVGEEVAERIIPDGFRVVLSQNAQEFDVERTDVLALGPDHEDDARAARQALGVGRVRVEPVPSNLVDIQIVVGRDFTA
jgi:LytR cell envelope-related transcriptional attenuator/LytR_cpsA_psr family